MQPDMSCEAIGGRLRLMGELWELSVVLMNSKVVSRPDEIAMLIEKFRAAANAKADFATPASKDAAIYDQMRSSYCRLKSLGKSGCDALAELLADESMYVRTWIASAFLAEGYLAARKVLENVASCSGAEAFNAKIALEEFDAGRLKTPFPTN